MSTADGDTLPLLAYYASARKHDATSFASKYPDPVIIHAGSGNWAPEKSFATTTHLVNARELRRTQGTEAGDKGVQLRATRVKKSVRNPFADQVYVGRANNNDIILEDESVSKAHAYFLSTDRGWEIRDADSANGTFVNGVRVTRSVVVPDGAELRFGECGAAFWLPKGFFQYLNKLLIST